MYRSKKNRKQIRSKSKKRHRGGGRTFNVPFPDNGRTFIPKSATYNNAMYVGEPCLGNHCGIPVVPSVANLINKNLAYGNSEIPPQASTQYPVIDRLGNSPNEYLPGVTNYVGTYINPGPFDIRCVRGGSRRRYQHRSKTNKKMNYR